MPIDALGRTISGAIHDRIAVNGTHLHYVSLGTSGSPILLVHGFPETWWAFHEVMPVLAERHRVHAVDLRGFGDSDLANDEFDSKVAAEDLHQLITALGKGPMHLVAQDISGTTAFRLAATHPDAIASFTAIEMGLPGFGMEAFADVTNGGAWYFGVMATRGIPDMLLAGREAAFVGDYMFPSMCAVPDAVGEGDVAEFARTYARPGGWDGATGLYASVLKEGEKIVALAQSDAIRVPVLAIGAGGGPFTEHTMKRAAPGTDVRSIQIGGAGHYAAMEAPERVAAAIRDFVGEVDAARIA
ncbi:alpha/beta hydrolase [Lichenihabitans sp. Uapishka_5]|uniref:alpha/beta fold hydrolase n=1 Tax=Lichenihabitans sp. Uapishka_5 TaxID=3037302 RepID=UPI0029E8163C|nr:alpha/beta hydrolase [Lichenihabitans sp. Uapishka_5]MDX7951458.1 alpha/beta hydrolase [Lichenihabitans sp. Uapishka_5]